MRAMITGGSMKELRRIRPVIAHRALASLAALCPLAAASPFAHAQEQTGVLEEVVVTARKRAENLQTTPVSVTAFNATALERQGIDSLGDLDQHVANFSMISGQGGGTSQSQISIRGVGQSDFILTADQSVGLYLDGVYIPRSLGAALDLVDVERIEVLRGPQGTLFGRNTTAGAVQVISAGPENELAGKAEFTAGRFERRDFKGSLNVPLAAGKVLSRFSVASLNQDGYGERLFQGTDGANTGVLAARAHVRAQLADQLQGNLIVDWSRKRGHGGLERLVRIDPSDPNLGFYNSFLVSQGLPPADARFITADPNDSFANSINRDDNDIFGASATLEWSGESLAVKSIAAYRSIEAQSGYDFDAWPNRI
jgi:iron complex outermembrane receptor protein